MIMILICYLYTISTYSIRSDDEERYFIKTKGCTIPRFKPFDKAVRDFFQHVYPIFCHNESRPPLIESDHNCLWIEEKYFPVYHISNRDYLECRYKPFYRKASSDDVYFRINEKSISFTNRTNIKKEFIEVWCKYEGKVIYKDVHSFAIKNIEKIIKETAPVDRYNLLILGIDTVSRLNFHRTMVQTHKYLQDSDAIEFEGYNKVGDNTYPNLIPVLSGLTEDELSNICYPSESSHFDDCHFIWNNYSEAGYHTAFIEDAPMLGLFNYLKKGFIKKPTDYYWRPFALFAEENYGHYNNLCFGPRLSVQMLLSYAQKFVRTMLHSPYFGFFWETSFTHDYLNFPRLCDGMYEALIKTMKNEGLLERTILVLLSDHGIRWGGIQNTHQGRMEQRLPFLFFVLPKHFKEKYTLAAFNMKLNTKRLTTPFDLHETMIDLLNTEKLTDEKIHEKTIKKEYLDARGISLFLPIHGNRTCQTAGIEPHWCTCHQTKKLATNNSLAFRVAYTTVDHINYLLTNHIQCAKLTMSKLMDLSIDIPASFGETDPKHQADYTVVVQTHPGGGQFEATVRNTPKGFYVAGVVSRNNLYGNQSFCIDDVHLKLYCYCHIDQPRI